MNNTQIFAVYDSAVEAYMEPYFCPSIGVAIRAFKDAVNKDGHPFNSHPDDYTLFKVGEYDPRKGELVAQAPHSLGNALEFVNRPHITE